MFATETSLLGRACIRTDTGGRTFALTANGFGYVMPEGDAEHIGL